MNLLVSYNWLKEFLPGLKATPEEVADKLSLHAFSVERLRRMDEGLDPAIVVGKIIKIEPHPNADKLRIARTTTNNKDERPRTIVCGGTNIKEGMLV
ncbi:phenylalanine--tRNA ligase subunit beta, partial [Candidatus Uhrbacteria bacterium]|nr:phenylalanine--tRNA ligase subunit beta [Candidatus Uhrbacteria bacterium]